MTPPTSRNRSMASTLELTPRRGMGSRSARGERQGSVLIVALGILTVLALLAVSFASVMRTARKATINYADSVRARFIAEAGIEYALHRLRQEGRDKVYTDSSWNSTVGFERDGWVFSNYTDIGNAAVDITWPGATSEDSWTSLDYQVFQDEGGTREFLPPLRPSFVHVKQDGGGDDLLLPWEQGAFEGTDELPSGGGDGIPPIEAYQYRASGFVGNLVVRGGSVDSRGNYLSKYSRPGATSDTTSGWNGDNFALKVVDTSGQIYLNAGVARLEGERWTKSRKLMGEYEPLYSMMYATARHLLNDSGINFPSDSALEEVLLAMADRAGSPGESHAGLSHAKSLPSRPTGLTDATCRNPREGDETISAAPEGLIKAILDRRFTLPGQRFTSKAQLIEDDPEVRERYELGEDVPGRPYGRLLDPEHFEAIKDFFCVQTDLDEAGVVVNQDPETYSYWVQTPPLQRTGLHNININAAPMAVIVGNLYGLAARTYRYVTDDSDNAVFSRTGGLADKYAEDLSGRGTLFPSLFDNQDETYELYRDQTLFAGEEDEASWRNSFQSWMHPATTLRQWAVGLPNLPASSQEPSTWDSTPWLELRYDADGYRMSAYPPEYSSTPDDRLSLCNKDVGPITYSAAAAIGKAIVQRRTQRPFRTYNELRDFLLYGDSGLPDPFPGLDDPGFLASNGLEQAFEERILQHLEEFPNPGSTGAYPARFIEKVRARMFVDLLMANCAPYALTARKNPDAHLAPMIEKGDLIHYTNPFVFGANGTFEITSLGRVTRLEEQRLGPPGTETVYTVPEIVAKREIRTVVKVWDRIRQTSQSDFESFARQNAGSAEGGQSLAWPRMGSEDDDGGTDVNSTRNRRENRRALVASWPNNLWLYEPGVANTHTEYGWVMPTPLGRWHPGNFGNGWDLAGLGGWGKGSGGWELKFGAEFDWTDRDLIHDRTLDVYGGGNPWSTGGGDRKFLINPAMSTSIFHGLVDRSLGGSASEDVENYEFPLFQDPAPPYRPYTGDPIGGFEDFCQEANLLVSDWEISEEEGVLIDPSAIGGEQYSPLMLNWWDWSEELNTQADDPAGGFLTPSSRYQKYGGQGVDPTETRQSAAHFDPEAGGLLSLSFMPRDRSNANPDGYFNDFQRRGPLFFWASNPGRSQVSKIGFETHSDATGSVQSGAAGVLGGYVDDSQESGISGLHQNLSFRDGGLEFWAKLDVRGSDPVPCGFFSSVQVTNMSLDREVTPDMDPSRSSPMAADANGQPTGGVAMYVFKDAFGYLRISRIAFEKTFLIPQFDDGNDNWARPPSGAGPGNPNGSQPMPLTDIETQGAGMLDPDWDQFEPHHDWDELGSGDGWNFWPRCDVIFDISDWGPHEWHHVAIGWHYGTILYEVSGTGAPQTSFENYGDPLLWIDGQRVGDADNVYAFEGINPVGGSGSNFDWIEEARNPPAPPPGSPPGTIGEQQATVFSSLLNVVGPFDHMTVGSIVRRQFSITDGVFRFFSDGVAANMFGGVDTALWDGYSSTAATGAFSTGGQGRRLGQDPWYRDRGNTVVLPANGTIDSFHTYEDWSQFASPPPGNFPPARYEPVEYDGLLSGTPPEPEAFKQGGTDIYPEFMGAFQFPDLEYPGGVTLGAISWTEIRPREMRYHINRISDINETQRDLATLSPYPADDLLHGEGCSDGDCDFSADPEDWPDVHLAWGIQVYEGDSIYSPELPEDIESWFWVEADPDRDGDQDARQPDPFEGAGAQSGIGGPLREDPADPFPVRLEPGDRLFYRAIFSNPDMGGLAGGDGRLLSTAALVDVTITILIEPEILLWEEKVD